MPAAILSPQTCTPAELDRYLARGWRPLGQRVYIADFIQLELGEVFSVIPTRLSLKQHEWRKGQRKLLRRNQGKFSWEIVPAKMDAAKRKINQRYLAEHPDKSTDDLSIHLQHEGRKIFQTYECNIYLEGKLVAFSYFDLGKTSAYSKAGIYDPDYRSFSLGLFSMYLEMQWCIDEGLDYYYPGYVSPDIPLFDYKKQIGKLSFWHLASQSWLPMDTFENEQHGPYYVLSNRMEQLRDQLQATGLAAPLYQYVFFEMRMMDHSKSQNMLDNPFLILLKPNTGHHFLIATYSLELNVYQCWYCKSEQMFTFFEEPKSKYEVFRYLLELQTLVFQVNTREEFTQMCNKKTVFQDNGQNQSSKFHNKL